MPRSAVEVDCADTVTLSTSVLSAERVADTDTAWLPADSPALVVPSDRVITGSSSSTRLITALFTVNWSSGGHGSAVVWQAVPVSSMVSLPSESVSSVGVIVTDDDVPLAAPAAMVIDVGSVPVTV